MQKFTTPKIEDNPSKVWKRKKTKHDILISTYVLKFNFIIQLPIDSMYLCISNTLNSTYIYIYISVWNLFSWSRQRLNKESHNPTSVLKHLWQVMVSKHVTVALSENTRKYFKILITERKLITAYSFQKNILGESPLVAAVSVGKYHNALHLLALTYSKLHVQSCTTSPPTLTKNSW